MFFFSSVLYYNSSLGVGLYILFSLLLAYLLFIRFGFRLSRGRLWDRLLGEYLKDDFVSCIDKLLDIIDVRSTRSLRLSIKFVRRSIWAAEDEKKNNSMNIRSGFRGRRNLIFYNNIDKLILKIGCNSENKTKYFDNSDNSFNDCIFLKLFFYFYSIYYFRISGVIFAGARRRRFDQIFVDLFRVNR